MKKIKINENLLGKVLGQVMIEPSIIKHLKGGNIYALGSDWNLEIKNEVTFKRKKVLRLIRKFKKNYELVNYGSFSYYKRKDW